MLLRVVLEARVVGLVQERQAQVDQVDDVDVEAAVRVGAPRHPLRHRQPDASGPGAGDDDHQRGSAQRLMRTLRRRSLRCPSKKSSTRRKRCTRCTRAAGTGQLVRLLGEAHHLDRPLEQAEGDEEVLGLLDGAAQVVLRVQDEERRVDVLRVGRRRRDEVPLHVLEEEGVHVAP